MTTVPCPAATCTRALNAAERDAGQTLCTPCVDIIGVWLRELPLQITVLEGSRQRESTGAGTGGRTVHRTAPLPGRADVLNLLGPAPWTPVHDPHSDQHGTPSIVGVLIPWVRLITEELRWNPPVSLTPDGLAVWLARPRPMTWASRAPWAGDYRDELHELIGTVRATTSLRPRRRAVAQPCPRCDSLTLTAVDHQLYTECSTCESMYTRDELALAARITVAAFETGAA
ncbi:hypothetical protein RM863_29255 [Streptomyces sp. DSM 41014]|uniref:ClpX-type ZB domain-containing protein n=1 Tax=Streptomyces hintoniae TaxID=3075521 RepID=A0ABU2USG9_9ACTN|nr:hypothetical protein [Streptomyces sp. DSM 41014]MDT0476220.1 hypothetical protein [Streptomyces sp. DSM 41014]